MKRTTISLPDRLAAALDREARRRRIPVSQLAREAIAARLGRTATGERNLSFIGIGRSGHHTTGQDAEEILAAEWDRDRDR